ncbi:MAG TPA: cation-translocating P-type ATPase [Spirochaetia bacterium]|nr:cation-translocating P-type ATPase [Spirochaetia bacterium]
MDEQWYTLSVPEVIRKLNTSGERGLDYGEAGRRLAACGPNILETAPAARPWLVFLNQFRDFMVLVLLAATATSLLLGEVADGLTILIIVLLNAVLGFVQESRAERSLEALRLLSAPEARVVREGRLDRFPARDLVPGDIVLVEAGDIVPADLRLLEAAGLEAMEAVLTGESAPTAKKAGVLVAGGAAPGDVVCALYAGTVVSRGRARGVVVETGMRTEMGRIAAMISGAQTEATPLQARLAKLGQWLLGVSLFVCALVVAVGVARGELPYRMFLTGVSLAVAAIPEGLPAVVTVALALGVQRMARRNAIIRRLPAVETLGCATVICSDKTGTLTENRMTVREGFIGGIRFAVEGEETADVHTGVVREDLALFLRIAVLCNNGILERLFVPAGRFVKRVTGQKRAQWRVSGDPTEGALLVLAARAGIWREDAEEIKVAEFPFESERKRMSVVCRRAGRLFVYAKGAPDVLLAHCTHYLKRGRVLPLDAAARRVLEGQNAALAGQAMRVLALAYREMPEDADIHEAAAVENGLILAGLAGLMDPPRREAAEAIRICRRAGIRVVMVTGDHPATALAVARELGLPAGGDSVLTGRDLDRLSDSELAGAVRKTAVFARVSPGHKLRIVRAYKKSGHVVAMTGDGVNDGPAVKEADIGIAMGKGGTDVTREASAMVLADDNFSTIVAAVEEGRAIYENIRKFIRYLLTCNTGEVLLMLAATMAGLPLPLLPIQILWVNLVTDGLPAMALGVDPPAGGLMTRPPRPWQESILARGLGPRIVRGGLAIGMGTLAVFTGSLAAGLDLPAARTMAFNTLVFFQLFYVFNCRSEEQGPVQAGLLANPQLVGAVSLCALLQLSVTYVPQLAAIFHSVPLPPREMAVSLAVAASPLGASLAARVWQTGFGRRVTCLKV